jgi:hypothetical protein
MLVIMDDNTRKEKADELKIILEKHGFVSQVKMITK